MDVLSPGSASVTGEVGDVTGEGCPGTGDGGHAGEEEVGFCATADGGFEGEDVA